MTCAQEKGKGCFQPLWQQYVKKEAGWAPRIIKRQQLSTLQVSVWLSWTGTGKRPSLCAAKAGGMQLPCRGVFAEPPNAEKEGVANVVQLGDFRPRRVRESGGEEAEYGENVPNVQNVPECPRFLKFL